MWDLGVSIQGLGLRVGLGWGPIKFNVRQKGNNN